MNKYMINPDEAPPGYKAQSTIGLSCVGCAFHSRDIYTPCSAPSDPPCGSLWRKDKQDVIFIKKT